MKKFIPKDVENKVVKTKVKQWNVAPNLFSSSYSYDEIIDVPNSAEIERIRRSMDRYRQWLNDMDYSRLERAVVNHTSEYRITRNTEQELRQQPQELPPIHTQADPRRRRSTQRPNLQNIPRERLTENEQRLMAWRDSINSMTNRRR